VTWRWRWLLMALAAVVVSCLVPGSMLSEVPAAARVASIEALAPSASGSNCAAVACNRGTTSSPAAAPSVALAGTLAAGILIVLLARTARRGHKTRLVLPEGAPARVLRPPQLHSA
jgi:hypothetical protein